MATFDSTNIQFTYVTVANSYSYSGMPLSDGLPEESQIQVRYNTASVYQGDTFANGGTLVSVSDLDFNAQEAIKVLSSDLYTIDTETDTISLSPLADVEITVPGSTTKYYYTPSAEVAATSPLVLRRSTDINNAVVTFAPGARLTAGMLNASATQLLHASQELTAFSGGVVSGGGSSGDVDLSGSILSDIGNVDTPAGSGVLSYDEFTQTYSVGATGSLVPAGGNPGWVLAKDTSADGDTVWYDIQSDFNALALTINNFNSIVQNVNARTLGMSRAGEGLETFRTTFIDDVTAASLTAERFEVPNGYLSYDTTTINQSDGVTPYNNVQLNIPGGDTGGGSYITVNEDNSVIRNTNSSGYEWFYQSGNTYDDSSTWIQDGAILIDPRAKDSFGNTYHRILNTEGTGSSYQNHSMIQGRTNRSMWRWDQNNYTYVIAPGDESGSIFASVKEIDGVARNIFTVDDDGNGFFRGNVTANGVFIEGSDATTKTYVADTTGSVIDKIQTLVTNGEAAPIGDANKFGTWYYNDSPGQQHYGPTTQGLAAVGLSIAKGVNIDVPAGPTEDPTDETDASGGSVAEASTETIETISMTGLLTKAAAELKDLDDALDARVTTNETDIASNDAEIASLLSYVTALEARVAALEGVDPNPPPVPGG